MRRIAWIALILLGLGSLLLVEGLLSPPPRPQSRPDALGVASSREPLDDEAEAAAVASLIENPSPNRSAQLGSQQLPLESGSAPADGSPPPEKNLDRASAETVRRTLNKAIADEQRFRPLFVSPGIVDAVASQKRVRVIFETDPGLIEEAAIGLLAGTSGNAEFDSLRIFPLLDRGAAEVGAQALLHLIENDGTGHIELDAIHRPSLAETIPIIRADLAHQEGHDGDGFAVAVLDTGVDPTHSMYADRIIEEACFSVQNDCPNGQSEMFGPGAAVPCPLTGCGHGTRVAGIALGSESNGGLTGVAPHAGLIAIQIFSNAAGAPGAYSSDILAGLQHVLGLAAFHQIASANLSLGGDLFASEADCDQTVASQFEAVELLRAAGVLTVAAAGNERRTSALTNPACLSNVIAVGSTSDIDEVSSFSNSAAFLRLLAPGESVESSIVGGQTGLASGTSMAASHAAGAIATIREAVPFANADEIENALALSGIAVFDARNGITTPRIRVLEAIRLLEATTPQPIDPNDPPANGGGGLSSPAATTSSNGSGGSCGLVGIEPFLVLGLVRLVRRRQFTDLRFTE